VPLGFLHLKDHSHLDDFALSATRGGGNSLVTLQFYGADWSKRPEYSLAIPPAKRTSWTKLLAKGSLQKQIYLIGFSSRSLPVT